MFLFFFLAKNISSLPSVRRPHSHLCQISLQSPISLFLFVCDIEPSHRRVEYECSRSVFTLLRYHIIRIQHPRVVSAQSTSHNRHTQNKQIIIYYVLFAALLFSTTQSMQSQPNPMAQSSAQTYSRRGE